jgi:anti-sigma regulatory factor (Ser/Thr protein kinase)
MHFQGEASVPGDRFAHQALIYGSDREFMDFALPFVEEGLAAKQPSLVAVQARHVQNLRAALGGTPEGLTVYSVEDWYETSARTRDKFARWVLERTARSGRIRVIGEQPWALGHKAQVRDWARYESVINVAFAGLPLTLICPYDAEALPEEILGHARHTHPEIVDADGSSASRSYVDPRDFCGRLDATVGVQRHPPSLELQFELDDLPLVRRLIGSFALDAGLTGARTEEIVLAANEIATNAVIHGRPPTTVRAWHGNAEIIVEVADRGDGIEDVLAGQLSPPPDVSGGRGLWLTRLLCDAVEVCNGGGSIVTMHAATPSQQPARAV